MTPNANVLTSRATPDEPPRAASPAPSAPLLPSSQLRAFVDALERLGYDVTSLLTDAGIRRAELDDPDGMIPSGACDAILGRACEQRRHPNLSAHLAAVTPIGTYPLLDYLVVTTDTVEGALEQLVRYFHLVNAPFRVGLADDGDIVRLVIHAANTFAAEYEASILVHHLREETERRLRPVSVNLQHQPENRADLERLLGCPVRAPSPWTGVEFSKESLRLPLRRRDPALRAILEGHAASVATRSSTSEDRSTVARVRSALASRLPRGVPEIGAIARQLAISPRTLQRRLAAEGVSYQQLVDLVRREAAERLLADGSVAIGEVGYLLGFSEASAFHRAFKRWHGVTPQQYRIGHRAARTVDVADAPNAGQAIRRR
jgi:AraC-like DNA-binding protein